jgi:DNA-binding NarL/FixJ family response regulator
MNVQPTALIAEDEPLLRDALRRQLANVWPELEIVAEARNGREAVRLFDERHPDICFLDVHMPGLSGVMPRIISAGARISCSSPRTITTRCRRSRRAHSITF